MIATPMYGGQCTGAYVQGLLLTMQRLQQLGIGAGWGYITNEALITRARNELVRQFLASDDDVLVFIDGDHGFDGDAIATLIAGGRDIACGICPKKQVNWDSVRRAAEAGRLDELADHAGSFVVNPLSTAPARPDAQGFIEIRHGGSGVMAIRRRVFEIMAPHVPVYRVSAARHANGDWVHPPVHEFFATSHDASGVLLSEDFHFCERWRQLGGQVFAQPFLRFTHIGPYVYSGDISKSGANIS